ncbi:MAG: ABC transporter permease [Clostridia bacterium]|nr:ABC transporter permease [Clostridia bacterium]
MLLFENISLALTSLKSNKMRAFLTMLGIIIGIGSVIAIFTVGDSLTIYVSQSMQELGANDVYVMVTQRENSEQSSLNRMNLSSLTTGSAVDEEDYISVQMINDMCEKFSDEVYAVNAQHQIQDMATAGIENKTAKIGLMGTNAGYYITNKLELTAGTMFSEKDYSEKKKVCIVSSKLVEKLFDGDSEKAVGKEITVNLSNRDEIFTIIGVYNANVRTSSSSNSGMMMVLSGATTMYIPLKTAFDLDRKTESFYFIQVITNVGVDSSQLASNLSKFFESYYRNNRNYTVGAFNLSGMVSMLTEMLATLTMAISIVAGIALIVGGIGVMNIMLVSVTERTREIGTRKALGAKNSSIRTQFIVEAMIICLIGGALGIVLGMILGSIASNALGYPANASIKGIIISLLFSMSIGLFFGYYPANKAAKMNPIDALRYE